MITLSGDPVTDFNNSTEANILPAHGWNGTYNEELFTQEALRLIATHTDRTPFYMYLAYVCNGLMIRS